MSMEVGVQEHERTGQSVDSICSTKSREISRQLPAQTPSCLQPLLGLPDPRPPLC